MKYLKAPFAMLVVTCIFCYACQTDTDQLINNELKTSEIVVENTQRNLPLTDYDSLVSIENFKSRMQWASYISAKVFLHNSMARIEVTRLISNKKVALSRLLGNNSEAPKFRQAFIDEVNFYYEDWTPVQDPVVTTRTDTGEQRPPAGATPCCPIGPLSPNYFISLLMSSMSEENGFELYFPNPLPKIKSPLAPLFISSTAHPISDAQENYGYLRYKQPIVFPDGFEGVAHEEQIDMHYVNTRGIIIIARPINGGVHSSWLPMDDFTTFLSTN